MSKVPFTPEGYNAITPYLMIKGAAEAIDYYKKVFGATEVMRMENKDGRIGHAELKIGDSHIMLADETPETISRSPLSTGGSPVSLLLYVEDVDSTVKKAVDEGAKVIKQVQDQFYGDRSGFIQDPFGHFWGVATHVEDVSPQELEERMKKAKQAA